MIKKYYLLFCLLLCSYCVDAQNIIDDLNTNKLGQGTIVIYQDDAISRLLGKNIVVSVSNKVLLDSQLDSQSVKSSGNFIKARGYRIQIYSGNDQKRSKEEAYSRRSSLLSVYPNMEVTVTYNSPVWRVKAGNFKTPEEATEAMNQMKLKFPNFAKEMHILNDVVKIPVE